MSKNKKLPIKKLTGKLKKYFNELITYTNLLYDTSSYDILYDLVLKYFNDEEKDFIPGTIGAYCAGCHVKTNFSNNSGCTPICAGSMPSKNSDFSFCQYTVILAKYKHSHFKFDVLKSGNSKENKKIAYIFVDFCNINAFPGFTESEKHELKDHGIKYIYLYHYKDGGRNYVSLLPNKISLDNVKNCLDINYGHNSTNFGNSGLIILIIILILVGLFFAWRYWQ